MHNYNNNNNDNSSNNFITLVLGALEVNCYLYHNRDRETIIIDPGFNPKSIIHTLKENDLTPKLIFVTHGHFDHVGAIPELKKEFDIPIYMHKNDFEMYKDAKVMVKNLFGIKLNDFDVPMPDDVTFIGDGETLTLNSVSLVVKHTPGHSQGSVILVNENLKQIFSGDTLFYESIGRTDLSGGNQRQIIESIKHKIFSYPDDFDVYPGHGSNTTVRHEKEKNVYLH